MTLKTTPNTHPERLAETLEQQRVGERALDATNDRTSFAFFDRCSVFSLHQQFMSPDCCVRSAGEVSKNIFLPWKDLKEEHLQMINRTKVSPGFYSCDLF